MAAAPNLDLSLDDMMATRPRNKGNRRGGRRTGGGARRNGNDGTIVLGGGGVARNTGNRESRRNRPYAAAASTLIPASADIGSKIIVSNLDFNVTEDDLQSQFQSNMAFAEDIAVHQFSITLTPMFTKEMEAVGNELFATQIGPLRKAALSFDQDGRSRGIAQVTFSRKGDAARAYERYHNVTLDGRPMRIEIVVAPAQSTIGRLVVGAPNPPLNQRSNGGRSQGGGRSRGRGGRTGRSGGGRGNKGTSKSAEDLDAEMSAYMNTATDAKIITAMDEDIAM